MKNNTLKSADLKQTRKRILILSTLEAAPTALTVEELAEITSKEIKMSISTIYRALNALSEKNVVTKTLHQDGKAYFAINSHNHKHVLICTLCNEKVAIENCPLETLEDNLTRETGYTITGHSLEFFGVCPTCYKLSHSQNN
ncbi:MAG: Fur family transcriptional regulator [Anaerocolumna sp.]